MGNAVQGEFVVVLTGAVGRKLRILVDREGARLGQPHIGSVHHPRGQLNEHHGTAPNDGSSWTRRWSITWPSEDSAVDSNGVSADTSTDSERFPTVSSIFTSTVSFTRISMPSRTNFLKPASSAWIV